MEAKNGKLVVFCGLAGEEMGVAVALLTATAVKRGDV
jgi:hypothetical protein